MSPAMCLDVSYYCSVHEADTNRTMNIHLAARTRLPGSCHKSPVFTHIAWCLAGISIIELYIMANLRVELNLLAARLNMHSSPVADPRGGH